MSTGSGKIKTVELVGGVKLMKFKIGPQPAQDQQRTLYGITVPKICIASVFKAWCV